MWEQRQFQHQARPFQGEQNGPYERNSEQRGYRRETDHKSINSIDRQESDDNHQSVTFNIMSVASTNGTEDDSLIMADVTIRGQTAKGLVDTGALLTLVRTKTARRLKLEPFRTTLKQPVTLRFGNQQTEVCRHGFRVSISYHDKTVKLTLIEYRDLLYELLLGINWVRVPGFFSNAPPGGVHVLNIAQLQPVRIRLAEDTIIPPRTTRLGQLGSKRTTK